MNEREIPFLIELRAELRRATQQDPVRTARGRVHAAGVLRFGAPVVVAAAVIAFVLVGLGGDNSHRLPVRDYQSSAAYHPRPQTKLVGPATCRRMFRPPPPPLIRSNAAPNRALMSELSLLRTPATPIDGTSLGKWDRVPLLISTIYQRYARVVNGPRGVKLAFFPADFCGTSGSPFGTAPANVFHIRLDQGLVMIVLSNPGEHATVLVGDARQIRRGPALAYMSIGENVGAVMAIVVPDGVARVVMKFTPPFLHPYSNTVQIRSNIGIVVRRPPYTPTSIFWYAANGHLIKKFVYRKEISQDNCLRHHRKNCFGPTLTTAQRYSIPLSVPADPQAKALYEPLVAYAHSTTLQQRSRSGSRAAAVGSTLNACDRPYQRQLFDVVAGSKKSARQARMKVNEIWQHASLMQTYEGYVAPVATQLRQLASAWAGLSLSNRPMNRFAHALAAELNITLSAPPMNTCAFVRALVAHHFSYTWAKASPYAKVADQWWEHINNAAGGTLDFWKFVSPPEPYGSNGGPGQHLFTTGQRSALANLPGELG